MPSENQIGSDTDEYPSPQHRMVDKMDARALCQIRPMREEIARRWLGAANQLEADKKVKEHFAEQIRRLKR